MPRFRFDVPDCNYKTSAYVSRDHPPLVDRSSLQRTNPSSTSCIESLLSPSLDQRPTLLPEQGPIHPPSDDLAIDDGPTLAPVSDLKHTDRLFALRNDRAVPLDHPVPRADPLHVHTPVAATELTHVVGVLQRPRVGWANRLFKGLSILFKVAAALFCLTLVSAALWAPPPQRTAPLTHCLTDILRSALGDFDSARKQLEDVRTGDIERITSQLETLVRLTQMDVLSLEAAELRLAVQLPVDVHALRNDTLRAVGSLARALPPSGNDAGAPFRDISSRWSAGLQSALEKTIPKTVLSSLVHRIEEVDALTSSIGLIQEEKRRVTTGTSHLFPWRNPSEQVYSAAEAFLAAVAPKLVSAGSNLDLGRSNINSVMGRLGFFQDAKDRLASNAIFDCHASAETRLTEDMEYIANVLQLLCPR